MNEDTENLIVGAIISLPSATIILMIIFNAIF